MRASRRVDHRDPEGDLNAARSNTDGSAARANTARGHHNAHNGAPPRGRGPNVAHGPRRSGRVVVLRVMDVEAVGVHHLGPRLDEVLHEQLAGIIPGIDLAQRAEL